jgi:hypothetical protein
VGKGVFIGKCGISLENPFETLLEVKISRLWNAGGKADIKDQK